MAASSDSGGRTPIGTMRGSHLARALLRVEWDDAGLLRRVSAWESSTAVIIYSGTTTLLVLTAIGWVFLKMVRRVARRRATG